MRPVRIELRTPDARDRRAAEGAILASFSRDYNGESLPFPIASAPSHMRSSFTLCNTLAIQARDPRVFIY